MKLFWKLFFTIMLVTAVCVSLSGGLLIGLSLRTRLEGQAETARDHGGILSLSLVQVLEEWAGAAGQPAEAAQALSLRGAGQQIPFALLDSQGRLLYSSLSLEPDGSLAQLLDADTGGWRLLRLADGWWIQSLYPAVFSGEVCYLETLRDVNGLFEDLRAQYLLLVRIMAIMLLPAGLAAWRMSRRLARPLLELTAKARRLADLPDTGPASGDEISLLSESFSQMSDRLTRQMAELREEAERKDRFVTAFSHELKTPMTSIIGYADLLRRREMAPGQRQFCAEYIFSEGKRLERLSMSLLDLTMLRHLPLETTSVSIPDLLDQVLSPLVPVLEAQGISLTWHAAPAAVQLDPVLMDSVLRNLTDNGRKAMEHGGSLTVTGVFCPEGYALTVQDTGRGMTPEELERITEAFYTADRSRSRRQGGAGLGLALCREILDRHGFSLSFQSSPGAGTAARILIREVRP